MDYGRIKKLFGTSTEIMESFKALINFTEDSLLPLIIDGFTSQKVLMYIIFLVLILYKFNIMLHNLI